MVPLGYVSRDKKLFIEEDEAERVRTIFQRYLELGSIGLLLADLRERGIVTKVRQLCRLLHTCDIWLNEKWNIHPPANRHHSAAMR